LVLLQVEPPADAQLRKDGKSLLNIRCGDWRDLHSTWDDTKQKTFYAKCMGQDCEQSLESGDKTPGCRFMDGNKAGGEGKGFCYAYNSAQMWCACVRLSFSLARSRSRLLSKGTKLIQNERAGVRKTRRTATATMAVQIGPRRHLALVCVEKHLDKKHVRECSLDLQRKIQSSIARSICTYTHTRTHTHTRIFCKYNFASPLTNTHLRRKC
jgi:hypothetical protein